MISFLFPALLAAAVLSSPAPISDPIVLSLPSAEPSGIAVNDRIWITFYPTAHVSERRTPAVVLLHPLGDERLRQMRRFARYLAERGIGVALMVLPYHGPRRPPEEGSGNRFTDRDVARMAQAASQTAADVSTVAEWLRGQPELDPRRIGVVGVSLGAIAAHLAMGRDERLSAGVAILGGGDLAHLRRGSFLFKVRRLPVGRERSPEEASRMRSVDPLEYAGRNRPRHVFMVQAARDLLVPPRNARALWEALGRPPIRWIDTNHLGIVLAQRSLMRASLAYLRSVWADAPQEPPRVPAVSAPTVKLGALVGLESRLTPALQWQAVSFAARRDHMSLLHADLGWSGRGPFLGLAATLNPFLDLGVARRFGHPGVRLYASLHLVF
jgi:dienelactone hydrolase